MNLSEVRHKLVELMVEEGHLIRHGDMIEDMGGHYIHESDDKILDNYIEDWLKDMDKEERKKIIKEVMHETY